MDIVTQLEAASAQLSNLDGQRTEAMRVRDDLIRQAREAGITWVEIQNATGLSPRAVALALGRPPR